MTVDQLRLRDNIKYLRWLLGHADQIEPLLRHYDDLVAAQDVTARWTTVKAMGDIVVGMIEDLPNQDTAVGALATVEACQAQAQALGLDWDKLAELIVRVLPLLLQLVQGLRG